MRAPSTISDPPLPGFDPDHVIYLVKPLQHKVYLALEAALAAVNIAAAQFRILGAIALREASSSAELARAFALSPQAMNKQVAALEARHMVRREVREHNRRALDLDLTPRGRAALNAGHAVAREVEARLLADFTDQERDQLRGLLWRMLGDRPQVED